MTPRDLDAEVAAKVLGCAVLRHVDGAGATVSYDCACVGTVHGDPNPDTGGRYTRLRRYSDDWGAMREVVEAVQRLEGRRWAMREFRTHWFAIVVDDGVQHEGEGATLPEAVAYAALAAVTQEARA